MKRIILLFLYVLIGNSFVLQAMDKKRARHRKRRPKINQVGVSSQPTQTPLFCSHCGSKIAGGDVSCSKHVKPKMSPLQRFLQREKDFIEGRVEYELGDSLTRAAAWQMYCEIVRTQ